MDIHVPESIAHYEPELRYFFDSMVQKLNTNRHKGLVEGVTILDMVAGLKGELLELEQALATEGQFDVHMEAVDVANFAWLVSLMAMRMDRGQFNEGSWRLGIRQNTAGNIVGTLELDLPTKKSDTVGHRVNAHQTVKAGP